MPSAVNAGQKTLRQHKQPDPHFNCVKLRLVLKYTDGEKGDFFCRLGAAFQTVQPDIEHIRPWRIRSVQLVFRMPHDAEDRFKDLELWVWGVLGLVVVRRLLSPLFMLKS